MPRADRLLAMVRILSGPCRHSLDQLSRELETSPRTIYRDLADVEARGIAIERVDGAYRLLDSAVIRPLQLTARERLVLTLALENPSITRQSAFRSALQQLRAKLSTTNDGASAAPLILLSGPDRTGSVPGEVVVAIERAIDEGHSISMLYASLSSKKVAWRGVDPWALVHRSETWYLIGRCHLHDEPRTFRLDRIESVLPIGTSFMRPSRFSASEWFRASWGALAGGDGEECVIVFEPDVAPLIEHARFHDSEEKRQLPDGRLEYRARVAPLDEIARWICGFGGSARAVEPLALVDRVRAIATGASRAHETKRENRRSRVAARVARRK